MSKAILGAGMLAGAAGIVGLATLGVGFFAAMPFLVPELLAFGGVSMEAGAIADALTSNRGMNITTRQAASYRQIIYGMQRVGGVEVYRSTTGSHKDQFNYVIVLAGHECWGIENLYLDGRQVYWQGSGTGWSVQNGIGFGGNPDGNTHYGPNGVAYNFGGEVFCEARYGKQAVGDVIVDLTNNDPNWAASGGSSPFVGGCTYVYLKLEYNTNLFPSEPEIRFTVWGKPVFDPRTSTTAYSHNWALIVNDVITDPVFGLGDSSVNQAQLVAAANVCDEQVAVAATSSNEDRYACHWHYDTSTGVGDILSTMMSAAGGRLSRIGGEWYIWPAYFQGASASFDASSLVSTVQWNPTRSFRDLFNRVTGTYIAPNFPYNIAGDLYDSNGYYNGQTQNNFPFAFQPTNYPQYAADHLHGYAADQYLDEDTTHIGTWANNTGAGVTYNVGDVVLYNQVFYKALTNNSSTALPSGDTADWLPVPGTELPREISQPCVLSVTQAQRLAKIALMRNRQQGTGILEMSLAAYQLQPCDTFDMTFAQNGWTAKLLEVSAVSFELQSGASNSAPQIKLKVGVNETDPSVYEWSTSEELSVYDVPSVVTQASYIPIPPTNMELISSAGTALVAPDGTITPRIEVTWDTPLDIQVTQIQMQYQLVGASNWSDAGLVDVSLNQGFISPVVSGQAYDVRIRSLRANGGASVWVTINGFTAGLVLNSQTQFGVGIGSLTAEAFASGAAEIICNPFTANIGQLALPIFPAGEVTLTNDGTIGDGAGSLAQQTLYYVYYVDPTTVGGNVVPIATTNMLDFLGKLGYWLIDSIVTPYASSSGGGSGTRFYPSTATNIGTRTALNPAAAYDGNLSTYAACVGASSQTPTLRTSKCGCVWSGFPSDVSSSDRTLYVVMSTTITALGSATGGDANLSATTGAPTDFTTTVATATYNIDVPAATDISTISVKVLCTPPTCTTTGDVGQTEADVYEIYIQ
jgi:hypothetical protein